MHAQPCLTLCDSMYYRQPDPSIHGMFQARYWNGLSFPTPGDLPKPITEQYT